MTPDIISINELAVNTIIGTYDWEKEIPQQLLINIDLQHDIRAAAASDDLTLSIDYAAIAASVTELAANSRVELIESLAENIATHILMSSPAAWCRVKVSKAGAINNAKAVSVCIERQV